MRQFDAPPLLLLLATTLLFGCGAAQLRQASDVVLSLADITCAECGMRSVVALSAQPGVATAEFDKGAAEIKVHFDAAQILPGDMLKILQGQDVKASIGGGHGHYLAAQKFAESADIQWISRGDAVDVDAAAVVGKVTVVDFGAAWCGPCRDVDADMAELLPKNPDVALRKIDIGDWDTPVAKQHLQNISALPYVLVYAKNGKRIAAIEGLHLDQLHAALDLARKN